MVSSKKERGKQLRAAKSLTAANAGGKNGCHEKSIVKSIRSGHRDVTYESTRGISGLSFDGSGILSIVLDFLKRCENDTFDKVMAEVGGNLPCPSSWIGIIRKAEELEPSCRMQIAQNIGPLVRCMCNDTKRVFFNNKKHWRESIVHFVDLITQMIDRFNDEPDDENKMIVDTLLLHDGLLRSIVQWGFWGEEHRPDITKELKIDDSAMIVEWGRKAIEQLVTLVRGKIYMDGDGSAVLTDEAKKLLDTIGTTPIMSKEYDPNCMVSYTAGLIRIMKNNGGTVNDVKSVQRLITWADCVDKRVIAEVIDFGFNYTANYETAVSITSISSDVIMKKSNVKDWFVRSDTRVACAIRFGLIEMCLSFIERFGTHESFGNDDEQDTSLYRNIGTIFTYVHSASLHKKSAKAIGSKKNCIDDKLIQLRKNKEVSSNDECKELLNRVRSVLDLNGAYCCRCNKSLGKNDIKRCNGCNRMTYCSKACQREDWLNGHNVTCNIPYEYSDERSGQFQGRLRPKTLPETEREAAKLEALEQNVNTIQLKLFLDNSNMILSQASSLDIPLYDCIVLIDLRYCPVSVKVHRYSEFYEKPEERRSFEEGRSKENITCMYRSNIYNGEVDEDGGIRILEIQRFYPQEWLSKKL